MEMNYRIRNTTHWGLLWSNEEGWVTQFAESNYSVFSAKEKEQFNLPLEGEWEAFPKEGQFDRNRHGSLHDRGLADAWYGRPADPHWYPNGTGRDPKITDLTEAEIAEYMEGFNEGNDDPSFRKDWGND